MGEANQGSAKVKRITGCPENQCGGSGSGVSRTFWTLRLGKKSNTEPDPEIVK